VSEKIIKPLIPAKTADEEQKEASEVSSENSRDEEIKRDRPPHY
jgi:hypothetical protein